MIFLKSILHFFYFFKRTYWISTKIATFISSNRTASVKTYIFKALINWNSNYVTGLTFNWQLRVGTYKIAIYLLPFGIYEQFQFTESKNKGLTLLYYNYIIMYISHKFIKCLSFVVFLLECNDSVLKESNCRVRGYVRREI